MYLLKISNSTFTKSLILRFLRLVNCKVWGIIFISKNPFVTLEIVRETPLIEIDAFSTKNFDNFLSFRRNLTNQVFP